jgi:hypothetical protein
MRLFVVVGRLVSYVGVWHPTSPTRAWRTLRHVGRGHAPAILFSGIWILETRSLEEGVGAAERDTAEAEVQAEALRGGLLHGVSNPLVHRGGARTVVVFHVHAEGAQRGGAAGEESVADGAGEAWRRAGAGVGHGAAVAAVIVVAVVAVRQRVLIRLLQGHGVDGGEDVAPPRREERRACRLVGRQEGEDVDEHAVLQLAQAVAAVGGFDRLAAGSIHHCGGFDRLAVPVSVRVCRGHLFILGYFD